MQQTNSCPSCGATVKYGDQFCGHCGNRLQLVAPSPSPPQHGNQYPNQQPPEDQPVDKQPRGQQQPPVSQQRPLLFNQQSGWNQPTQYNQPPAWGNRNPAQQQIRADDQKTKPQKKKSSRVFLLLVILIAVIFIVSGIALVAGGSFSSTSKPASNTPAPTAPTQPAATPPSSTPASPQSPLPQAPVLPTSQATPITATELIKAYTDDPNGSRAKYDGNVYVISGKVSSIGAGGSPAILYLYDKAAGPFEIQCTFLQGQESDVASMNPGQSVKVEGRVLNFSRIIVVDKCRLVQ